MLSIQLEDNIAESVEVLPHLAIDEESAFALMVLSAAAWIRINCPAGFEAETVNRPGGMDVVVADKVVASYSTFKVAGIFTVHGEFGLEVKAP